MTTDFNFFALARDIGLWISGTVAEAPDSHGVYMLFDQEGRFIYVGKADGLRQRLGDHFSPQEDNMLIRMLARYFVWEVTPSLETAEAMEGAIYDTWLEQSGYPPLGNRIAPPRSKYANVDPRIARLRILLTALKKH